MPEITVVIPTHAGRERMLRRALWSVLSQTMVAAAIVVEHDLHREGSAITRNRGLFKVTTEWVAFLDSDDQFLPQHLEILMQAAVETGADVIYPWPQMVGGTDPSPDRFGQPFDGDLMRRRSYIPVTSLVRTKLAQDCGGFHIPDVSPHDDHGFYLSMLDAGARFVHVPVKSWIWNIHGHGMPGVPGNTSGLASRT
jgi:glycosyltransferase involved in cell wall biosynthesis